MFCCIVFSSCRSHTLSDRGQELQDKTSRMMYVRCMIRAFVSPVLVVLLLLPFDMMGEANRQDVLVPHPDHGAPFHEQLSGQWALSLGSEDARQIRFYEDGRFAFLDQGRWTAGSFFILRSDEKSKGVLRLEYYLDGNLHFQEVLCEIHFAAHADHEGGERPHDEAADHHHEGEQDGHHHDHEEGAGHTHEMLKVESLPAAERALNVDGSYGHVH